MAETRDKVFSIRLTQSEYEYIKEQAERLHCPVGQFIRMKIWEGVKKNEIMEVFNG